MTGIKYSELDDEILLTTQQLAHWFQVSPSFLNKGRTYGTGPKFVKIGGSVRYRVGDARRWLDEMSRQKVRIGYIVSLDDANQLSPQEIEVLLAGNDA